LKKENPFILDVRDVKNWRAIGHIPGAHHCFVGELPHHLDEIPKDENIVVYCDAGIKEAWQQASCLSITTLIDKSFGRNDGVEPGGIPDREIILLFLFQ